MQPVSFGLGIIAKARTVASIKARFSNYKDGRERFQTLDANLDRLLRHTSDFVKVLEKFPTALPTGVAHIHQGVLKKHW